MIEYKLSFLLIEDQWESLYRLLKNSFPSSHIFKAKDIQSSLSILKKIKIDVIILNYPISYHDAYEITKLVKIRNPKTKLFIYTEKDFKKLVNEEELFIKIFKNTIDHPLKVIDKIKEFSEYNLK